MLDAGEKVEDVRKRAKGEGCMDNTRWREVRRIINAASVQICGTMRRKAPGIFEMLRQ